MGVNPATGMQTVRSANSVGMHALSEAQFEVLRAMARRHAGISLADHKLSMVQRRVAKRILSLGLDGFEAYCCYLGGPDGDREIEQLVNALTTNKTDFFRERHHFEHLANTVLPAYAKRGMGRLRIWSAGCSSGQEPYSIAMTMMTRSTGIGTADAKILATDIDTDVLARAAEGLYPRSEISALPDDVATSSFAIDRRDPSRCRVAPAIRDLVSFRHLNLHAGWPMKGPFDAIFCRNVVIYFDKPTQRRLFDRFADILVPDGWLYVGHSESLFNVSSRFRFEGQSIYRKIS